MRFLFTVIFPAFVFTSSSQIRQPNYACDTTKRPIVFVHGFLGSGDNWAKQIQRFNSNGYCEQSLFVFDWNTVNRSRETDSLLTIFIDRVLQKTGSKQVDLVGHSAGGGLCYSYLSDSIHALKVAHYVHIGSGKMKTAAGKNAEVPTMNIYSKADYIVKNGGDIPGAVNVMLETADHMQVATARETFLALYSFLNDNRSAADAEIKKTGKRNVSFGIGGRGVTLGENNPLSLDSFTVYNFNAVTGKRELIKRNSPTGAYVKWTKFAKDGSWGFNITGKHYLEFEIRPSGGRRLYYFFEPQEEPNKVMYLRAFPSTGMMAGVLNQLPKDSKQTLLIIFSSSQAVIAGRDTLAIDSIPLSTQVIAPASKTMISAFVFDDGDGKSTLQPIRAFGSLPFLGSIDLNIPADAKGTMRIYFNGRSMVLPRRPASEGVMIAVFN